MMDRINDMKSYMVCRIGGDADDKRIYQGGDC